MSSRGRRGDALTECHVERGRRGPTLPQTRWHAPIIAFSIGVTSHTQRWNVVARQRARGIQLVENEVPPSSRSLLFVSQTSPFCRLLLPRFRDRLLAETHDTGKVSDRVTARGTRWTTDESSSGAIRWNFPPYAARESWSKVGACLQRVTYTFLMIQVESMWNSSSGRGGRSRREKERRREILVVFAEGWNDETQRLDGRPELSWSLTKVSTVAGNTG